MWQAGSTRRGLGLGLCLLAILLAAAAPAAAQDEERPPPPPAPVADDALTAALEKGALTEAEYALERARSVFQLERVRREYGHVARPSGGDVTVILRDLAARVNHGDVSAAWELQRQLEPEMGRIIRRVLRAPGDNSPLARRVRAAVQRTFGDELPKPAFHPEALIDRVAQSLCDKVVAQLGGDHTDRAPLRETVRS